MAEIATENGWHERSLEEGVVGNGKDGGQVHVQHENPSVAESTRKSTCLLSVPFLQKVVSPSFLRKKKKTYYDLNSMLSML